MTGFHNIYMTGAAGSGKSMIAKCIPGILPALSYEEKLCLTKIYSVAGLFKSQNGMVEERPFRHPHSSVTETALLGEVEYLYPAKLAWRIMVYFFWTNFRSLKGR